MKVTLGVFPPFSFASSRCRLSSQRFSSTSHTSTHAMQRGGSNMHAATNHSTVRLWSLHKQHPLFEGGFFESEPETHRPLTFKLEKHFYRVEERGGRNTFSILRCLRNLYLIRGPRWKFKVTNTMRNCQEQCWICCEWMPKGLWKCPGGFEDVI